MDLINVAYHPSVTLRAYVLLYTSRNIVLYVVPRREWPNSTKEARNDKKKNKEKRSVEYLRKEKLLYYTHTTRCHK